MTMLMNQLKMKNPKMFQMLNNAMKNGNNPMEMFKQMTANYTPEQMNNLMSQAKNMGFPDSVLNEVQNGINTR